MKKICIIMLLAVAILAGCASRRAIMKSWMGYHIDKATASWGAPESRISRNDGGFTYTWTTFSSNQYGVQQCRQSFVTDSEGVIVSWSYSGCSRLVRTW